MCPAMMSIMWGVRKGWLMIGWDRSGMLTADKKVDEERVTTTKPTRYKHSNWQSHGQSHSHNLSYCTVLYVPAWHNPCPTPSATPLTNWTKHPTSSTSYRTQSPHPFSQSYYATNSIPSTGSVSECGMIPPWDDCERAWGTAGVWSRGSTVRVACFATGCGIGWEIPRGLVLLLGRRILPLEHLLLILLVPVPATVAFLTLDFPLLIEAAAAVPCSCSCYRDWFCLSTVSFSFQPFDFQILQSKTSFKFRNCLEIEMNV